MRIIITLLLALASFNAQAQCSYKNTALKNNEFISYNLYFNWEFVWVKAGTASLSTIESVYKGKKSFRTSLITRTSSNVDNMFLMRDTLLGYCTTDLVPLYYRKGAREADRYTVDEAFYSYANNSPHVRLHRQKNDGTHVWETKNPATCVYDMVNLFQRSRSFDASKWQKGHTITIDITDGVKLAKGKLKYLGTQTVKADNGKKYNCVILSYIEFVKGKEKEIARFFVNNDSRHIPVRIDLNLKFGSAKAYLTSFK